MPFRCLLAALLLVRPLAALAEEPLPANDLTRRDHYTPAGAVSVDLDGYADFGSTDVGPTEYSPPRGSATSTTASAHVGVTYGLLDGLRLAAHLTYVPYSSGQATVDGNTGPVMHASGLEDPVLSLLYRVAGDRFWSLDTSLNVSHTVEQQRTASARIDGNEASGGSRASLGVSGTALLDEDEWSLHAGLTRSGEAELHPADGSIAMRESSWLVGLGGAMRTHFTSNLFAEMGVNLSLPHTYFFRTGGALEPNAQNDVLLAHVEYAEVGLRVANVVVIVYGNMQHSSVSSVTHKDDKTFVGYGADRYFRLGTMATIEL